MSASLKRECGILLIASVVLLSILALLPDADVDHDAGYTSSELSIRETVDENVTSTSYVNPDGVITVAIDIGYATVCRMRDDNGRVVEKRYLDANGYPVARYGDYYGLSYEYDETSTVITYLDAEENPVERSDGYSTIVRTQVGGRAYDDFFYDLNGQQVQCSGGYYGLRRGYNAEGQNISLAFLDKDGRAVCTLSGYAIMTYQRDSEGTVIGERYFDTEGKPVKSSLGQYGELYQRNEQGYISQITYLDLDGNPAPTNAGYTILKRTYHRDGTADTDMFNSELKRIVVKGCNENDRDALRWCVAKPDKRKSRKMSCRLFSELLYEEMDWSVDCRYKILGYRIEFEGEALYVFDLVAAEVFHERKKKSAVHQSTTVVEENKEEQPVNPRKGYYSEDIAGTFGVPVEQHRQESELRQMDGFVSVGMLTGMPGQQKNL